MAGTRLLVTLSFAIPFVFLVFFSLWLGIPHDDLLWKRLGYVLFSGNVAAPPKHQQHTQEETGGKPMLLVPSSWTTNAIETALYQVIPTEGISTLCEEHSKPQDLDNDTTIVLLCPKRSTSNVLVRNDTTLFVSAASIAEFRKIILTDDDYPYNVITPHVRLMFDQSLSNNKHQWKALVDETVEWTAHWKKHHHVCLDDTITVDLEVVDHNNMKNSMENHPTRRNTIVLYFTSEIRAEEMQQKMGGAKYHWNEAYVYLVTDVSSAIAKLQDGLQRIILHECWNLPHSTTLESPTGLETLHRLYNATFARRLAHQIRREAAILQHRVDHFHFTTEKTENIAQSLQFLARGNWSQAKRALDGVRFRMSPDFPWDQYAAIFAPLLFPLLLPITLTTAREWKRYNKQHSSSVAM